MLSRFARCSSLATYPRTCIRLGLATLLVLAGARSVHDASATGDTRALSFHHTHSGEDLTITFKRNGRYDEAALQELNHFLRDWRSQEQTKMDRHLFDILWEVYRDVDARQPIQIISSYRSPATNAMLRRRSAHTGVARFSQHMLGHAMDFFIPGVPLEQIRFAGLRLQRGGVGFYPTSGSPFVHLDTGNVRHWPRMTRDQLVRVFPNGRTVHVPADGNPLPGYELALAEVQNRRSSDESGSASDKPSLLASLFRGKPPVAEEDDEGPTAAVPSDSAKPVAAALTASVDAARLTGPVPLPRSKPTAIGTYQVASAGPQPVIVSAPANAAANARSADKTAASDKTAVSEKTTAAMPQTPADIINARGFWGDEPARPKQATPAQIAALSARNAFASVEAPSTTSQQPDTQALAYAPVTPPLDRAQIVAASAPMPRSLRPASPARNPMAAEVTTIVTKGQQGLPATVTTAARLAPASNANSVWMRAMIVAPSASTAMLASSLGDPDLTTMRALFVKPVTAVTMTFCDDPQLGVSSDRFSGPATTPLAVTSFVTRTASLR